MNKNPAMNDLNSLYIVWHYGECLAFISRPVLASVFALSLTHTIFSISLSCSPKASGRRPVWLVSPEFLARILVAVHRFAIEWGHGRHGGVDHPRGVALFCRRQWQSRAECEHSLGRQCGAALQSEQSKWENGKDEFIFSLFALSAAVDRHYSCILVEKTNRMRCTRIAWIANRLLLVRN